MIEDAELLRRYAGERSEAAFAELVRRRVDLVYSVARRQCGGERGCRGTGGGSFIRGNGDGGNFNFYEHTENIGEYGRRCRRDRLWDLRSEAAFAGRGGGGRGAGRERAFADAVECGAKIGGGFGTRAVKAEEQRGAWERTTRGLFSNTTVSGGALTLGSNSGPSPEGRLSLAATPPTNDPEQARQQTRNLNRPGVRMTCLPFYRKLGLTPEESSRFDALVPDNTERGSALFKKAAAQSPARDRGSLQTVAEVINDQNHASLGALASGAFGDKSGAEFNRFQETMALRPVTNQLASGLFIPRRP